MGIPGSKLHHLVQSALPKHLCICSAWLGKKSQATSPETAASGTEGGVDQNDKSLCHGLHQLCQLLQGCSLLTCIYRGGYNDKGSVEDYQLSSEMLSSEWKTMKIPMAEIMHGNWWKKGSWRPGKEDGTCLRKEGTRTPSFQMLVPD
jgi:hypothetical protein